MRELDQLLVRYLEQHYVLSLPDPQLMRYLLSKEPPAPEFVIVVGHILDRTDA
jgi:succinate dehydrogenase flavin-adding protein (antitoxin of CptAB toxin-antitoxin module)